MLNRCIIISRERNEAIRRVANHACNGDEGANAELDVLKFLADSGSRVAAEELRLVRFVVRERMLSLLIKW